ncbi:MAG: tryptophan--tRNA ligase [Patescibacteria group bacterium]|nr:tryptophan--tRNA ligase [Patescibacteria group bacterium]
MPRVFSGMRPSGELHLGNYLGALKNWLALQNQYECLFCIVDYHAITTPFEPKKMKKKIFDLAVSYLAAGLDPKKSIIFIQSEVPEVTELAWIFNSITPIGELKRMTQFKEKSKQHPESVNIGLLDYPVLMAADILLYKAELVPVGEDQVQHVELTRTIARKFNKIFGPTFPEPKVVLTKAPRVMSLKDPTKKMSKTGDEGIALVDPPEIIWKKLSIAVTDPARKRRTDPGEPKKCNLYSLHELFTEEKIKREMAKKCRTAQVGCLECKKILAENIAKELAPFRKKYLELSKNQGLINKILADGAQRAKKIASETLNEVKKKIGLR